MPVPTSIADLSTTAASNSPAGADSIGTNLDDYLRTIQAIVKQQDSKGSDIASSTSITIPNSGSYFVVTGTTAITSIVDNWNGRTVALKFSGILTLTHSSGLILPGSANITTAAGDTCLMSNESTGVWRCVVYQKADGNSIVTGASQSGIQLQSYTRFTSGGTADAITGTLSPAIASYTAGLRVTTKPVGANTVTGPTLNLNTLGVKTIKKRDSGGSKAALVAGDFNASGPFNFEYDGVDFVLLDPLPAAVVASSSVPVRQTVLSGPVDSSGFSAFGGSTGSTTVTASGTLKATACAGGDANYTGSIVNPSWTGLSTNGTMYLYLDITSGGVVTTGSTTLEPTYQWGGTYSTTNGQNTYNIQECTMKVGNGATAAQVYRVFVGEVTVAGGVTTAIVWYALMARYDSGWIATIPAVTTLTTKTTNIGVQSQDAALEIKCLTAELGYSLGDVIRYFGTTPAAVYVPVGAITTRNSISFMTGNSSIYVQHKSTGAIVALTNASWAYRLFTRRAW